MEGSKTDPKVKSESISPVLVGQAKAIQDVQQVDLTQEDEQEDESNSIVRIDGGFTYPFKWKKRKGPYLPDGVPPDKRLLRLRVKYTKNNLPYHAGRMPGEKLVLLLKGFEEKTPPSSKTMPRHNTKCLFLLSNADLVLQSGHQLSESGRTGRKNVWTRRHTNYERRQSTS